MHLIAKVIRISHAKFHCSRLTTVGLQYIQDYESLIFLDTVYIRVSLWMVLIATSCFVIVGNEAACHTV